MEDTMNIEQAIASGKLSPAARDMNIEQVIWQYAEANGLDEHEAEIELDAHHERMEDTMTLTISAPRPAARLASGIEGAYVKGRVARPNDMAHDYISAAISHDDARRYVTDRWADMGEPSDDSADRALDVALIAGSLRVRAAVRGSGLAVAQAWERVAYDALRLA